MPYIKVNDGIVVLGGQVSPTSDQNEWFMYTGHIPKADLLLWDYASDKIVVHPDAVQQAIQSKVKSINTAFNLECVSLTNSVSEYEVSSWDEQAREAREWLADNNTDTPLLSAIATARKVTIGYLVNRVLDKNKAYLSVLGGIIGKRQALEDIINNVSVLPEDAEDSIKTINMLTWENYTPN